MTDMIPNLLGPLDLHLIHFSNPFDSRFYCSLTKSDCRLLIDYCKNDSLLLHILLDILSIMKKRLRNPNK
jgi:hypothetical protein